MNQQFTPAQVIISQAEYAHLKRQARGKNLTEEQELMYKEVIIALASSLQRTNGNFDSVLKRLAEKKIKFGLIVNVGRELTPEGVKVQSYE